MFYLMGWGGMGWDGMGNQKCPLFFLILRYIKHYPHINLNIYIKNVLPNFLWVLKLEKVGGPDENFQNTL